MTEKGYKNLNSTILKLNNRLIILVEKIHLQNAKLLKENNNLKIENKILKEKLKEKYKNGDYVYIKPEIIEKFLLDGETPDYLTAEAIMKYIEECKNK